MPRKITRFAGEYKFLSNFVPVQIEWEGETFPSLEHAFQAAKTLDPDARKWIRDLPHPADAKKAGGKVFLRPGWDAIKIAVMADLLNRKFSNPRLRQSLIETRNALLVEGNTWGDRFWGVDLRTNQGHNWLGRLLVLERARINLEQSTP